MLRGRALTCAALAFGMALRASPAWADHVIGSGCSPGAGGSARAADGNNEFCNGSIWQYPPYQLGATTTGCNSGSAGMMQWTGGSVSPNNTFEYCNGSNWTTVNGSANSVPLSGILAATTTSSIDSGGNAITWNWNSLSSGTGFTIATSHALTGGTLMSLQATAASATSTGYVLSVTDASTGTGYGVYSAMTGAANTGYAGYFTTTATIGANYALYALNNSTSGWGVYSAGSSSNYFAGDVGIGTTTRGQKLEVNGNTRLDGLLLGASGGIDYNVISMFSQGTITIGGNAAQTATINFSAQGTAVRLSERCLPIKV